MEFSKEYQALENRVVEAFMKLREENEEIIFYKEEPDFDDMDEALSILEDCPTSFYNDKHGIERHIYILKIDKDGIFAVESEDYKRVYSIGFNELNGLYYKIQLVEEMNNLLN
jgi:hypothetical protein